MQIEKNRKLRIQKGYAEKVLNKFNDTNCFSNWNAY